MDITTTMKIKTTGMVLNEMQLEQVAGGLGITTVLGCLYTAGKTGMAVYKETKALVTSPEYVKMTDKQKTRQSERSLQTMWLSAGCWGLAQG